MSPVEEQEQPAGERNCAPAEASTLERSWVLDMTVRVSNMDCEKETSFCNSASAVSVTLLVNCGSLRSVLGSNVAKMLEK